MENCIINSNRLYFSKIQKEDIEHMYPWFADSEFLKYYDYLPPVPQSKEVVDKAFNYYQTNEGSDVFAIKMIGTDKVVGIAGFDDIIKDNKVATMFIGIGDKSLRGHGFGKEALDLLLKYGFKELLFHRIQLNVLQFNHTAISMYEKAGFIKEGTFREFVLRDGERYDLYLYGLLKHEWELINN